MNDLSNDLSNPTAKGLEQGSSASEAIAVSSPRKQETFAEVGLISPFELSIPQEVIDDLYRRLDNTRWADRETVDGWSQGAPLAKVQALCRYWRNEYDWRRCEERLNQLGQFKTEIDGLGIHFLHVRSPHANAIPLLITHGWPGSVIEFLKVIGPLTDPVAYGGKAEDAFHLVMPSLPGYGFSDKPSQMERRPDCPGLDRVNGPTWL
jgi:hypothetical protein